METDLTVKTSNGAIELDNVHAANISVKFSNGIIHAANTAAQSGLSLRTSNGKISVEGIAATTIDLNTSNGAIKGTVRGKKEDYKIRSDTSNGSSNLSDTDTGSKRLTVKTSNGSIEIGFSD